ncbi:MAG TPA: hypothetical protein VFG42_26810 [Baekduia sp.]|uniref:hypothetical protein n=1 Tax=Baekduia sp. TaxID=2600305 RepID=UPI002D790553|nr:hypothetical protein [Baekduia sp.]HET6510435.1 hypothetical protein [Baekduia sp.]
MSHDDDQPRTLHIGLDLRLDGEVVEGRATADGSGPAREFSGWVGLLAALDALTAEAQA